MADKKIKLTSFGFITHRQPLPKRTHINVTGINFKETDKGFIVGTGNAENIPWLENVVSNPELFKDSK